jgi:hypothetical protein
LGSDVSLGQRGWGICGSQVPSIGSTSGGGGLNIFAGLHLTNAIDKSTSDHVKMSSITGRAIKLLTTSPINKFNNQEHHFTPSTHSTLHHLQPHKLSEQTHGQNTTTRGAYLTPLHHML